MLEKSAMLAMLVTSVSVRMTTGPVVDNLSLMKVIFAGSLLGTAMALCLPQTGALWTDYLRQFVASLLFGAFLALAVAVAITKTSTDALFLAAGLGAFVAWPILPALRNIAGRGVSTAVREWLKGTGK